MRPCRSLVLVAVLVAAVVTLNTPATADGARRAADAIVSAANDMKGVHCGVKPASRTILCIVNATDRVTEQFAGTMVLSARANDMPLRGWKVTITNLNDWVVTRDF